MPQRSGKSQIYLGAVALVAATAALRVTLTPWLNDVSAFLPFILPIAVIAYLGGVGPAVLATALSAFSAVAVVLRDPRLALLGAPEFINFSMFVAQSSAVIAVTELLRRERQRADEATTRAKAQLGGIPSSSRACRMNGEVR